MRIESVYCRCNSKQSHISGILVKVQIDGESINMELDTGASVTVV